MESNKKKVSIQTKSCILRFSYELILSFTITVMEIYLPIEYFKPAVFEKVHVFRIFIVHNIHIL